MSLSFHFHGHGTYTVNAAVWVKARHYIPVHYGTWPPIAQDGPAWCQQVEARTGAQPHCLRSSETWTLA